MVPDDIKGKQVELGSFGWVLGKIPIPGAQQSGIGSHPWEFVGFSSANPLLPWDGAGDGSTPRDVGLQTHKSPLPPALL